MNALTPPDEIILTAEMAKDVQWAAISILDVTDGPSTRPPISESDLGSVVILLSRCQALSLLLLADKIAHSVPNMLLEMLNPFAVIDT